MKLIFTVLVALLIVGCASNDALELPDERVLAHFQKEKNIVQKWKPTESLPISLQNIGFSPSFEEAYLSIWTDGGSVGYLLRDDHGVYFAFCVAYPKYYDGKQVVEVARPTYFAGVMHPSEEGARIVPSGSPTESFLRSLLKKRKKTANSERSDSP